MEKKFTCYCGLYCKNCAVKVQVEPAAQKLYEEMQKLNFGDIMSFFPDGEKFWNFLKGMASDGICVSCREGSGNPACKIRHCASEKKVEMCALCDCYPCNLIADMMKGYHTLYSDNALLRNEGWKAWGLMQDDRVKKGMTFSYQREINPDRITPDFISELKMNEIFVFGSNLSGAHGGGAARIAHNKFGAVWGQGVGLQGQSYAIPTMHGGVDRIQPYVDEFIIFADEHPNLKFLVTRIGCGIAGFEVAEIAPLFARAVDLQNVALPLDFWDIIRNK